jgi:hypothetical protein
MEVGMSLNTLVELVISNLTNFLKKSGATETLKGIPNREGKLLIVNNSFFFRDSKYIKTNKSAKYLAIPATSTDVQEKNVLVLTGPRLNSEYKLLADSDDTIETKITLSEAINQELGNLGKIVFVLIGQVDDNVIIKVPIETPHFHQFILNPAQPKKVNITDRTISCNSVEDEASNWTKIETQLTESGVSPNDISDIKQVLGKAFDQAKSDAYATLTIPKTTEKEGKYFLDKIGTSFEDNIREYATALSIMSAAEKNRREAYNEVLRIAYNFTDDALTVLRLLVSICDLKPLIMWGTFMSHYNVVEAVRNLPWARQITKPALSKYIRTVKRARNKSFHRLLPFTKPIDVDLPAQALRDVRLRFFAEYGTSKNTMDFRDKEVVDLLLEFTRTSQEVVADEFWVKNLKVMQTSHEMILRTSEFLKNCLLTTRSAA